MWPDPECASTILGTKSWLTTIDKDGVHPGLGRAERRGVEHLDGDVVLEDAVQRVGVVDGGFAPLAILLALHVTRLKSGDVGTGGYIVAGKGYVFLVA